MDIERMTNFLAVHSWVVLDKHDVDSRKRFSNAPCAAATAIRIKGSIAYGNKRFDNAACQIIAEMRSQSWDFNSKTVGINTIYAAWLVEQGILRATAQSA